MAGERGALPRVRKKRDRDSVGFGRRGSGAGGHVVLSLHIGVPDHVSGPRCNPHSRTQEWESDRRADGCWRKEYP
jgi:hypothetical protein